MEAPGGMRPDLIDRFLAGRSPRTVQAYVGDLHADGRAASRCKRSPSYSPPASRFHQPLGPARLEPPASQATRLLAEALTQLAELIETAAPALDWLNKGVFVRGTATARVRGVAGDALDHDYSYPNGA